MARETREDRIVRNMTEPVVEHLHELKALSVNPDLKEADLERWCQSLLKTALGYSASNGYVITAQEKKGKLRPDLIVAKDGEVTLCIEVKKLGFDLNKSDFRSGKVQLGEYLHALGGVRWGMLTNGYEWRLYDFHSGGVEILNLDLRNDDDQIEMSKRNVEDVCWSFLELHEASYAAGNWKDMSKEATVFSPESLARAILSADVVKVIVRTIRGEHDYKVNFEMLVDKISYLIEHGLDDCLTGWSESHQVELHKYVKAQKRAGRPKKRSKKADEGVQQIQPQSASVPVSVSVQPAVTVAEADKVPKIS